MSVEKCNDSVLVDDLDVGNLGSSWNNVCSGLSLSLVRINFS